MRNKVCKIHISFVLVIHFHQFALTDVSLAWSLVHYLDLHRLSKIFLLIGSFIMFPTCFLSSGIDFPSISKVFL